MSKLKIRVLSGVIGAVCVLGLIFSASVVFHAAVVVACLIAVYELHRTFELEKKWQVATLNYLFALGILAVPFFSKTLPGELLLFLLIAFLMLILTVSVLFNAKVKFTDATRSFFILAYGVLLPMHISYIRLMDNGIFLVFLSFLGAWMPDTFAFFAGKFFGKRKLIPSVSPNKTIAGSIGAVVGAVISFLVYAAILIFGFGYSVRFPELIVLSLLCGVLAQFGDLSASVIKRECGKKDFGNLIPGHGGILDRIDSLVFIAPLVYYFLRIFEVMYK